MFKKEDIIKYADGLLIGLNDEEIDMILNEFESIKENMDIISSFDGIKDVEVLSYPQDIKVKSLRDDNLSRQIPTEDALLNAPKKLEDVVIVPKVVG